MMGVIGLRGPGTDSLLGTPRTDQEKKNNNNNNSKNDNNKGTHSPHIAHTCTHTQGNTPPHTYTPHIHPALHTHNTHIQPPQHSLWAPTHGFPIAEVGVKQVDESLSLTPPHVRDNSNTPKQYTHTATGRTIGRVQLKLHTTHIPGIQ
jgi:hypothetical protein